MPKSLFWLIFLKEKALKIKALIYIFYYNIIHIFLFIFLLYLRVFKIKNDKITLSQEEYYTSLK